jgi:ElaB/YqjD/DUF883 family membrane-anchored ribosome-binding protein
MASDKQFGGAEGTELGRSMNSMAESIEGVGGQTAQALRDIREAAELRAEVLMDWVKQRPLTSVLIGAAVGYVLGRMARR